MARPYTVVCYLRPPAACGTAERRAAEVKRSTDRFSSFPSVFQTLAKASQYPSSQRSKATVRSRQRTDSDPFAPFDPPRRWTCQTCYLVDLPADKSVREAQIMRAAAVVVALALGAECFAPAPSTRASTALNAAGHAVIVRCSVGRLRFVVSHAVDAVCGASAQCCGTSAAVMVPRAGAKQGRRPRRDRLPPRQELG